jgi:hypothetical protein
MAFACKYRSTFVAVGGVTWTVDFEWDGWGGGITALTPGVTPLVMRYNTDDKYNPIVSSSLDIQVVYESAVDDFFVENEKAVRVRVRKAGAYFWLGFLVPNQYFKKFSSKPYYANFTATDQFKQLQNIKFEDGSGDPYYGLSTDLVVIGNILDKLGYDLLLKEELNIYEVDFDRTAADSPLDQVYFYPEMYWNETTDERGDCYTVLSDILKKYGARIFQWDNNWYIQRPNAAWSERTQRGFSSANPPVYASNALVTQKWNRSDNGGVWLANPEITMIPRLGRAEITADPKYKSNAIKNSTFRDFTQTGGLMRYWTTSGAMTEADGSIDLHSATTAADYIKMESGLRGVRSIRFVMECRIDWDSTVTSCVAKFKFEHDGYSYTTSGWTSGSSTYDWDIYTALHPADGMGAYGTFQISFPMPQAEVEAWDWGGATTFDVTIYELETSVAHANNHFYIRDVRLEVDYLDNTPQTIVYSFDNTVTGYNVKRESLRQIDADYVAVANLPYFVPGDTLPYLHGSTSPRDETVQWYIYGDIDTTPVSEDANASGTAETIQELLARQYVQSAWLPREVLTGTLHKGDYAYYTALEEDELTDAQGYPKIFVPVDMERDVRLDQWTGTWEEATPIYTDLSVVWDSHTYGSASISGNNITLSTNPVVGTDTADSDDYTCIEGEMIRVIARVHDYEPGSDLPNYDYDGNTGTLAEGYNYLQFRATTGANLFQINHTNGENADCQVQIWIYSLKGM